jgi:RNA polymerase sigma factor (sigma-70 family)
MYNSKRDNDIIESVEHAYPLLRHVAYRYDYDYEELYQVAAEAATLVYDQAQQAPDPVAYIHRAIRNQILIYTGAATKRKQTLSDHYLIGSLDAPLAHNEAFSLHNVTASAPYASSEERDFSRLYACIEALPAIYREVICMRFGLCGYGASRPCEIARLLGISQKVVDSRLRYAKKMLQQYSELIEIVEDARENA